MSENQEDTSIKHGALLVPLDSMLWVLQTIADAFALEPKSKEKISGKEVSEIILAAKAGIEKDFTERATYQGMH
jgi:hypothetical protein